MNRIILFFLPILLIAAITIDSLFSVVTKKEDALVNHQYTRFILVDDVSGLTLGKSPITYDASKRMPINYFTLNLPQRAVNVERVFVVHTLVESQGGDDYDWVLEDNSVEKTMIFSRRKFISQKIAMYWRFIVRGERVLLKNLKTGRFLRVNADATFSPVDLEADASRWKFIHVF